MNDRVVDVTTQISIYVQLIILFSNIYGLTISVPDVHLILKDILILETFVQSIEFLWYYFVIQNLPQEEMAINRYYDWVITTPLMLVSMFSYLLYEEQLEKNPNGPPIRVSDIIKNNAETVTRIIVSNFAMLSVGYLYEIGQISKQVSFAYGLLFLVNTFSIMYSEAGRKSRTGRIFILIMFLLWSIYGIAFILPTVRKNSIFNITDLFSKNFFEVYITALAFTKRN
jgi:bacteriorhodopsin